MNFKEIFTGFIISLSLVFFVIGNFILKPGLALSGDLTWSFYKLPSPFLWFESGQFPLPPQQIIIYGWLWNIPLNFVVIEKLIYILIFFLMSYSAYYVTLNLLKRYFKTSYPILLATLTAILYVFNPLNVYYMPHIFLLLGYSLYPFIIYLSLEIFKEGKTLRSVILLAIVITFMSGDSRWIVWDLLTIFWIAALHLICNVKKWKHLIYSLFVLGAFALLLNLFWILPFFSSRGVILENHLTQTPLSEGMYNYLNRYSNFLNSFRFQADGWAPTRELFFLPNTKLNLLWMYSGFVLPIFAISVFLLFKKKDILPFIVLSMFFFLFSIAPNSPSILIKKLYHYLVFNTPFGFVFRTSYKWLLPVSFNLTFLASLSLLKVYKKVQLRFSRLLSTALFFSLILLLVLSSILNSWVLITGDRESTFSPKTLGNEYRDIYSYLLKDQGYFKIIILPKYPPWRSPIPLPLKSDPYIKYVLNDMMNQNFKITHLLSAVGIKYIIYDNRSEDNKELISSLKNIKNFKLIYRGKYLSLFQVNKDISYIKTKNAFLSFVGLNSDIGLLNNQALIFISSLNSALKYWKEDNFDGIILNGLAPLDLRILMNKNKRLFSLPFCTNKSSEEGQDIFFNGNLKQLIQLSNQNNALKWKFDYKDGLVFTRATSKLKPHIKTKELSLLREWNFENIKDIKEWKNSTKPNKIFNISQDNGTLEELLFNSTWGWKTIKSPLVPTSIETPERFTFKIRGQNAWKSHVKIFEYDGNKSYINGYYIKSIGTGNFSWRTISLDYIPKSPKTKYLQLQIWHGHLTNLTLPNKIWLDNVKVYNLSKYRQPVSLNIPFSIKKENNYVLFVRYFKNQKGGKIKVYLDNKEFTIKTKDQLNKFVWKELGTFSLNKGEHVITLENIYGFNAVNLFALIPQEEYNLEDAKIGDEFKNKTMLYVFEAENDLYNQNCKIKEHWAKASNGGALIFKANASAWQELSIIKPSYYKLAFGGIGNFSVYLNNFSLHFNNDNFSLTYSKSFWMSKGNYTIRITGDKNSALDVLWLYSTNKNQTLNQLFTVNQTPATVTSYRKINPTLWKVNVNATKPFMLSFAESYDPLWEARVYKGTLIQKVKPIPLYGVINGFWINQTGNLKITIRYKPQDWFDVGLIISLTTFTLCIIYLLYEKYYKPKAQTKTNGKK